MIVLVNLVERCQLVVENEGSIDVGMARDLQFQDVLRIALVGNRSKRLWPGKRYKQTVDITYNVCVPRQACRGSGFQWHLA